MHESCPPISAAPDAPKCCDVLVIGGGPAGSTAATQLARRGWTVLLAEAGAHPRFHIGESLLPMNLPILDRLGVREQVAAMGVYKAGADFTQPDETEHLTFRFDRALGDSPAHAFEVERAPFDTLLFDTARKAGADCREHWRVDTVDLEGDQTLATVTTPQGRTQLRARYVLDATGRDTLLARRNGGKRKHPHHASAAVYAHFDHVPRRPGADAGNISVYHIAADSQGRWPGGWMWMIPLPDPQAAGGDCTRMSVGIVCPPGYMKQRRGSLEAFLWQAIRDTPAAAARMQGAVMDGKAGAAGNYSYACDTLGGPRHLLIGDAACFVDPLFSSGVYLGMRSAELAVEVADTTLRGAPSKQQSARLVRRYHRQVRRGADAFAWFVHRFTRPAMRQLLGNPNNVFGVEQAVISMLAGDGLDNPRVRRRLWLFRRFYNITTVFCWIARVSNGRLAARAGVEGLRDAQRTASLQ